MEADTVNVGILSDTHNWLRPEIKTIFADCDCILHAGDICSLEILMELEKIAPVHAVRGNMDNGFWAQALPERRLVQLAGVGIYILHNVARLDLKPESAGIRVVVYGHTHRAKIQERGDVLYLNPGSAGPSRGSKASVARMRIDQGDIQVQILELHEP
ncbi:MAG: metallophosphoesterase family protein [Anaerolineales bacterium]|nr:metallophosphoesterase family protein [Anaerolineales bacterium]